jgi:hypothetical protein
MTSLEEKFESLIERIEQATREVEVGKMGNFESLNREITAVCTETQNAPKEEAKSLQTHMGKVILKLDELAAAIGAYKDNLEGKKS